MDFYQHVFAGNPLDRAEVERRDENWIADQARDYSSRFLPMRGPNVLVNADATGNGEPALGWVGWQDLEPHVDGAAPLLLGLQDGITHFAIDLTRDESAAEALEAQGSYRFEEARGRRGEPAERRRGRNNGPGTGPGQLAQPARFLFRLRPPHRDTEGRAEAGMSCLQD